MGQDTCIEDGMISTRKARGSLQIAAHTGCIQYVPVVFQEDLLHDELGAAMESVIGYSKGLHNSLKDIKEFLEGDGTGNDDEPMVRLQNALANTASNNPSARKRPAVEHQPTQQPLLVQPPPPSEPPPLLQQQLYPMMQPWVMHPDQMSWP